MTATHLRLLYSAFLFFCRSF